MDMCRAVQNSVRAHCRKDLQIIVDTVHVVRHLNDALNTVRKADLGRALGRFKKTLSGKQFVLMACRARVGGRARDALDAVLAASPRRATAHVLKESFVPLWDDTSTGCALRFWGEGTAQLQWSRLTSSRRVVKGVERQGDGILAFCDKTVSLGSIESSTLKARNVIRRAYGYRDKDSMTLKVIHACTPWMAQFRPWTVAHSSVP